MKLRRLFEHAEMGVYILFFRGASTTMSIKRLVELAATLADRVPPALVTPPPERTTGLARSTAVRVSRFVPGATCLHRALASRVWLARRGVPSQLVVGFRRDGGIEGHAWLELEASIAATLFEEEGYEASFRESDLLPEEARDSTAASDSVATPSRPSVEESG